MGKSESKHWGCQKMLVSKKYKNRERLRLKRKNKRAESKSIRLLEPHSNSKCITKIWMHKPLLQVDLDSEWCLIFHLSLKKLGDLYMEIKALRSPKSHPQRRNSKINFLKNLNSQLHLKMSWQAYLEKVISSTRLKIQKFKIIRDGTLSKIKREKICYFLILTSKNNSKRNQHFPTRKKFKVKNQFKTISNLKVSVFSMMKMM
jgi:hypothetical protein